MNLKPKAHQREPIGNWKHLSFFKEFQSNAAIYVVRSERPLDGSIRV